MHRTSGSGHLQNLTSLEGLCATCVSLGPLYNPPIENLSIANMQLLVEQGKAIQEQLVNAESKYKTLGSARRNAFLDFNSNLASVRNIFQVACSNEIMQDQFDTIYRKLTGQRAIKIEKQTASGAEDPSLPEQKHISVSQTGYDDRLANFEKIISLLKQIPEYDPNEANFTVNGLVQYFLTLKEAHQQVNNAIGPCIEVHNNRDYLFYTPVNGIVDVGRTAKKYLKAILKPSNPLYKDVSKFTFKSYQSKTLIEIQVEETPAPQN